MRTAIIKSAIASLILLGFSSANAISVNIGASTLNGNSVTDYSGSQLLSFDMTFNNNQEVILVIDITPDDLLGIPPFIIDWNGFYTNNTSVPWSSFVLSLAPTVEIETIGSVTHEFAPGSSVNSIDAQTAEILFDAPGEISGFELGSAPAGIGAINWQLDLAGLAPGTSFTLTMTPVPVPAAVWLFGSALAGLGWMRRRR